jgi:hypothetical protein
VRAGVLAAVAVSASLAAAAPAAAAPLHPPRVPVARDGTTQAVALAGSRLAWIGAASDRRLYLWSSDGGRARRLKRLSASPVYEEDWEEVSLKGSSRELAWRYSLFVDNRLSVDDDTSYWVRDRGNVRRYSKCYDGRGNNFGVDVDGRVVALARGRCDNENQITLLDFSRSRKPKPLRIAARYPTGGVHLAGRYVAWQEFEFFIDRIVVWDWQAGREAYRFMAPGEQGLTWDLQADGKVLLTYQPDFSRALGRLGWYSPDEPVFHELPGAPDFSGVHATGERVAYTRVAANDHARAYPFVVENLSGEIEYEIAAPRRAYLQDFDGRCVAWSDTTPRRRRGDRLVVAPVAAQGIDRSSACSLVRIAAGIVQRRGRFVSLPVQCRTSTKPGCRGTLVATADGGVLAGRRSFAIRPGLTRSYRIRVPRSALRTSHSRRKLRLRVAATADAVNGVAASTRRTVYARPARRH